MHTATKTTGLIDATGDEKEGNMRFTRTIQVLGPIVAYLHGNRHLYTTDVRLHIVNIYRNYEELRKNYKKEAREEEMLDHQNEIERLMRPLMEAGNQEFFDMLELINLYKHGHIGFRDGKLVSLENQKQEGENG
jgi:hypothetical protein